MKERLKAILDPGRTHQWAPKLPMLQLAMNSAVCTATGYSPAYLAFGSVPADPLLCEVRKATLGLTSNTEALYFVSNRSSALLDVKEQEESRHEQMKLYWSRRHPDRKAPMVGDTVWVAAEALRSRAATRLGGLERPWVGPCTVSGTAIPNVTVELPASHHGKSLELHLKYVKLAWERDSEWESAQIPAVDGNDAYEIDQILDITGQPGNVSYLVSYKGYDPVLFQHWVTDIQADKKVKEFVSRQPPQKRAELRKLMRIRTPDDVTIEQEIHLSSSDSEEET